MTHIYTYEPAPISEAILQTGFATRYQRAIEMGLQERKEEDL